MTYQFPFTIESGHGEKIIFKEIWHESDGDRLIIEGHCEPGSGPVMHVHFKQDEGGKVVQGKLGYQFPGKEPVYLLPGQSVTFHRNQPHRFWNAGDDELIIDAWVKPANNIIFFLSTLYNSTKRSGKGRPERFDGAYLLMKYKDDYDVYGVPKYVKKVVIPLTYHVGRLLGKYNKFKDEPV